MSMDRLDYFEVHLSPNLRFGEAKDVEWLLESYKKSLRDNKKMKQCLEKLRGTINCDHEYSGECNGCAADELISRTLAES